jgi:hypothetical protein
LIVISVAFSTCVFLCVSLFFLSVVYVKSNIQNEGANFLLFCPPSIYIIFCIMRRNSLAHTYIHTAIIRQEKGNFSVIIGESVLVRLLNVKTSFVTFRHRFALCLFSLRLHTHTQLIIFPFLDHFYGSKMLSRSMSQTIAELRWKIRFINL